MRNGLILCLCFSFFSSFTLASESSNNSPTITIGVPEVLSGKIPEKEEVLGFMLNYWTNWAYKNNYQPIIVEGTFEELSIKLKSGEVDFITTATSSSLSSSNYLVSLPYISLVGALYENIGVKTHGKVALNLPPNVLPSYFDRGNDVILHSYDVKDIGNVLSDVDYVYTIKTEEIKVELERHGLLEKFVLSNEIDPGIKISALARKDNTSLIRKINHSIINDEFTTQLDDWYKFFKQGSSYYSLLIGTYDKNLSPQKLNTLAQLPTLSFSYIIKGSEPDFTSDGFFVDGYLINILKKISRHIGINFEPVGYEDFDSAFAALERKEVDLFPGLFKTNERSFLAFTQSIGNNIAAIASKENYSSSSSLEGLRIALVEGYAENKILKSTIDFTPVIYSSMQEAVLSVSEGNTDAFVGNIFNVSYQVSAQNLHNLKVLRAENFNFDLPVRIGLQKKHQNAVSLFNYALFSLGSDLQTEAQDRWKRQANSINISSELDRVTKKYTIYVVVGMLVLLIAFMVYRRNVRSKLQLALALKSALANAEAQQKKAEQLATAKTDFLARMSHEIRTPMNGVLGMAEALTFTELNKEQKGLLNSLNGAANSLLALLNDVLDFSKMEAGKLTIEEVNCNIKELLGLVRDNFIITANDKGLAIDIIVSDSLSSHYLCDTTRLMQVLNNLVSNAIKFTEKGAITIEASLVANQTNSDTLVFYVKDTGIGIPDKAIADLFNPFTQAENSITRKFGGTGLGLSICKEIVDAMKGDISVASIHGVGTQFKIQLELKRSTLTAEKLTDFSPEQTLSSSELTTLHLLLVEDNELNRQVISGQLNKLGVSHDYAVNGQEGYQLCQTNHYDIVLSDCHMPIMDGFALARKLSAQEVRPYLIALTADVVSGTSQKCLEAGFNDYLSKPCPIDILKHKLLSSLSELKAIEHVSTLKNVSEISDPLNESPPHETEHVLDELDYLVNDFLPNSQESHHLSPTTAVSLTDELFEGLLITIQSNPPFSPNHVIEICGDDESMAKTILSSFLDNVDQTPPNKGEELNTKQQYKDQFHKLKGSFLYLGLETAGELSQRLEIYALDINLVELKEGLNILSRYMDFVTEQIELYLDEN
ncbi:transporter substrate-binding domain-containing protein [Vibrio sp. ZSDE26]|uniref:histidine kinase n=1 Tax=Vibrio amylolyticus TaxID=2847292 RepID=A0A9X1XIL0_9VIBR|nr:ATP-binding protein [Vibrio amylolyticus]MCK6263461.1 transporter substrate-binding domain-containing protein [Vibrio amylolyticus]